VVDVSFVFLHPELEPIGKHFKIFTYFNFGDTTNTIHKIQYNNPKFQTRSCGMFGFFSSNKMKEITLLHNLMLLYLLLPTDIQRLMDDAIKVRKNAYAP
jgi:hypothetical protein